MTPQFLLYSTFSAFANVFFDFFYIIKKILAKHTRFSTVKSPLETQKLCSLQIRIFSAGEQSLWIEPAVYLI